MSPTFQQDGTTALMLAAWSGQATVTQLLLDNHADPNTASKVRDAARLTTPPPPRRFALLSPTLPGPPSLTTTHGDGVTHQGMMVMVRHNRRERVRVVAPAASLNPPDSWRSRDGCPPPRCCVMNTSSATRR